MDLSLVQSSLIFLAPYLQKGFEGLAGKLGERVYTNCLSGLGI